VVTPCICRQERRLLGEGCDRPLETCISFGAAGNFFLQNGLGRQVSREAVLEILTRADRSGLVLQPSNGKQISWICCCCGCCCGVLRSLKRTAAPARLVSSPFAAALEESRCQGCGVCLQRCQMEALTLENDRMHLDAERCIGCGLCIPTCPTGALSLQRKARGQQPVMPHNITTALLRLAWKRGQTGPLRLSRLFLSSAIDRCRVQLRQGADRQ
jgi:ferredoxin